MTWSRLRRIRQAVQVLAFALYVYLLFATLQVAAMQPRAATAALVPLADLFFRLDPLAALGAMLADRAWIPRLALALVTLGLTLLLGRVWCGWLCPLGTLLEWARFRRAGSGFLGKTRFLRRVKYFLLLLILAAALFGNLSLLILDPITLFTRTMTTAILPALNHAVTSTEHALYAIGFLRPAIDGVERVLRGPVLPVAQPVFAMNVFIASLFAGLLALNALADRFWCRYLCPLGALLGLLSKISLLRPFLMKKGSEATPVIGASCNRCARCVGVCRVDAIQPQRSSDARQGYEIIPSECTVCLDCLAACHGDGISFRPRWRPDPIREYDPTRRQALIALAAGAAGVAVLRTGAQAKQPHPQLIRPPGAQDEDAFLSRCLRCSQCMEVCPTSGLQPALLEAGLEGLWTPRLAPRLGYCDYGCNACGQACPSGAIPSLDLARKREQVLGIAVIDRDRCLPWAHGIPCIVCEEMCPTPEKAVRLEEVTVTNDRGESVVVQRPHVLEETCIGCGICEYQCPVGGQAAIRVYRR